MGQISRAVRSQRARRQEEKRIKIIKDRLRGRIDQSLRETICMQHNFQMRDEGFMESQEEVCEVVACSEERMEVEMNKYFPVEGMTLSVIGDFMAWLFTPMGEPIQPVCLPWCKKLERSVVRCVQCRGRAPVVSRKDGEKNQEQVIEKGDSSGPIHPQRETSEKLQKAWDFLDLLFDEEGPMDPMMADPDVVAMSSACAVKSKKGGGPGTA